MSLETHEPATSSNIRKLTYDPDTRALQVHFKSSAKPYTYSEVPAHVYRAMVTHPSVGEYFHRVIKRHYKEAKP